MKELGVFCTLAILLTGCSATSTNPTANMGQFISSSMQDIGKSLLSTPVKHQMDSQGWVTAYEVPKNAPEYHVDINKPSIKKSGSIVRYNSRVVYLKPERLGQAVFSALRNTDYTFTPGDYIASEIIVNCATKTYGSRNSVFYDHNDRKLMNCPWEDVSAVKMKTAQAGSIIEHTVNAACK